MLLCADEEAATAALASGMLACPSCRSGRLRTGGLSPTVAGQRIVSVTGGPVRWQISARAAANSSSAGSSSMARWKSARAWS